MSFHESEGCVSLEYHFVTADGNIQGSNFKYFGIDNKYLLSKNNFSNDFIYSFVERQVKYQVKFVPDGVKLNFKFGGLLLPWTRLGMSLVCGSADVCGFFSCRPRIVVHFREMFSQKCFKNALTVKKLSFSVSRYYLIPH